MEYMLKCRKIRLYTDMVRETGLQVLIAELAPIEMESTYSPEIPIDDYDSETIVECVFLLDSFIAQKLLVTHEEIIEIDRRDFDIKNLISADIGIRKAYFHTEYIRALLDKQSNIKRPSVTTKFLKKLVSESIIFYQTDAYFTSIFKEIINFLLINEGFVNPKDLNRLLITYEKLCSFLLFEVCRVETLEYVKLNSDEKVFFRSINGNIFERGSYVFGTLRKYALEHSRVKNIVLQESYDYIMKEKESPGNASLIFGQLCMQEGYSISIDRIKNHIDNLEFLSHESIDYKGISISKLFLTPAGINYIIFKEFDPVHLAQLLDKYIIENQLIIHSNLESINLSFPIINCQTKGEQVRQFYLVDPTFNTDIDIYKEEFKDHLQMLTDFGQINIF